MSPKRSSAPLGRSTPCSSASIDYRLTGEPCVRARAEPRGVRLQAAWRHVTDTHPWQWFSSAEKVLVDPPILRDDREVFGGIFDQHDVVEGETIVRWFHMSVIALFVAAVVLFAVQNRQIVTTSFLGFSASVPMALLTGITYLLGMATGGSLLALLRWLVQGARPRSTTTS